MKKIILGGLFLFLILTICIYWYIQTNSQPISADTTIQQFVINQGEGVNLISSRLVKNKLIHNKYVFLILAHQLGLNNNLQAGLFKLSPSMSTSEIIQKLSTGGNHDYWLKILEGQRLAQINPKFDPSLEGYIFPDSYLIPEGYTITQITDIISQNFTSKFNQAKLNAQTKLTDSQIIILASLIEREGRSLEAKKMISGILQNRLSINMALQVDATAQYIRDTQKSPKKYWLPATKADLTVISSYNTYLNPGLPPGPICNPGYDSIFAAFHPTESDYLYYITGNDNQMHYAKTLDEHNQNITKYLK